MLLEEREGEREREGKRGEFLSFFLFRGKKPDLDDTGKSKKKQKKLSRTCVAQGAHRAFRELRRGASRRYLCVQRARELLVEAGELACG